MKYFDVDSLRLYLYDISAQRLAATKRSAIDDGLGHVVSSFGMNRRCHSVLKEDSAFARCQFAAASLAGSDQPQVMGVSANLYICAAPNTDKPLIDGESALLGNLNMPARKSFRKTVKCLYLHNAVQPRLFHWWNFSDSRMNRVKSTKHL